MVQLFFWKWIFDAIPIKQYSFFNNNFQKNCYSINQKNKLVETYRKASSKCLERIKSYKTLRNLQFIEYPKKGFDELNTIINKVLELTGGILLVDYGYLNLINQSTIQSVMKNKKIDMNSFFKNLGKADITYLVNFSLLQEHFLKKKLKVKKIVSQKFFLEKMGIIQEQKCLKKKWIVNKRIYVSNINETSS